MWKKDRWKQMICNHIQLIVFACLLFAARVTFAQTICPAGSYENGVNCPSCEIGFMCMNGAKIRCAEGTYQSDPGQSFCNNCPENNYCLTGVDFVECPTGYMSKAKSSSCTECKSEYYMNANICTPKKTCNTSEYETVFGGTLSDRTCKTLTKCNATQFVIKMATSTTDRQCGNPVPCQYNEYTSQTRILNAENVMLQPQICSQYTNCTNKIKTFDGL
jgi:hypothetical protein